MTKSCADCVWLGRTEQAELIDAREQPAGPVPVLFGTCRYNPPVLIPYADGVTSSFPNVGSGDWCRRHRPSMKDPTS